MIAYLNSELVSFLFKAKNITIKRSKTKLEHGLPIPSLKNFETEDKIIIIKLIKHLTFRIIDQPQNNQFEIIEELLDKFLSIDYYSSQKNYQFKEEVINAFEKNDESKIKMIIDTLFFWLFNLDKNELNNLLNEYYPH
jgi:hypothetical protein